MILAPQNTNRVNLMENNRTLMAGKTSSVAILLALTCASSGSATQNGNFLENSVKREPSIEKVLTWDALAKVHKTSPGEMDVGYEFHFINRTGKEVQIKRAFTSCGCTVAKLPQRPWGIKPGQKGSIPIIMDLRGKAGTITKDTTLITDQGTVVLKTRVIIGGAAGAGGKPRSPEERAANLRIAAQDRQAIFQNNCAECHVKPTIGKRGKQLYTTACGICHDASHRAPFVPDLRPLAKGKDRQYWQQWTADSKPNTLMPAFAKKHGGSLDENQIKSLVAYLTRIFPRELKTRRAVAQRNKPALK